jgi:hypothetical protein
MYTVSNTAMSISTWYAIRVFRQEGSYSGKPVILFKISKSEFKVVSLRRYCCIMPGSYLSVL